MSDNLAKYERLARRIRAHALKMTSRANASHVGSCLSVADMLAVLYGGVLRFDAKRPDWPERDRLVVSKGHAAAATYAVLAECGFFPVSWLDDYCQERSPLEGHVTCRGVPGVEVSTGSLGHGLPIACGMALAARQDRRNCRIFVILSDGDCQEGSTWEAALFAHHHKLDNLTAIVDSNQLQAFGRVKEVLDLDPLLAKWRAFGWSVKEIDGHDHSQIEYALLNHAGCIIAHTVKGKGVSFMEDQLAWHYKSPNSEELARALAELGDTL